MNYSKVVILVIVVFSFGLLSLNEVQQSDKTSLFEYLGHYQKLDQFRLTMKYNMYNENQKITDQKDAVFVKDETSYRYEIKGEVIVYQNDKINVSVYDKDSIIAVSGVKDANAQMPNQIIGQEELKYFTVSKKNEGDKVAFELSAKQPLPIGKVIMQFNMKSKLAVKAMIHYNDKITQGDDVFKPTLEILYQNWKNNVSYNASSDITSVLEYDFKKKVCQLKGRYKSYRLIDLYKKNN